MGRILLFISIAVLSFGAGLGAIYWAMPMIDPDGVDEMRSRLDSIITAEQAALSGASTDGNQLNPIGALDSLFAPADSVGLVDLEMHPRYIELTDSLGRLATQVASLDRERSELLTRLGNLERELEEVQTRRSDASELSATLTRLEEIELQNILSLVDERTLAQLYHEATGRNKTRILSALPSDRAARLVQSMMASNASAQPSADPVIQ